MSNSFYSRKIDTYSEHPELLSWIEADDLNPLGQISKLIPNGSKVLDVGCGAGLLGRLIKQKNPSIKISGVEPSISSDHWGLEGYQNFHQGYLEDAIKSSGWVLENDCYVFADVIEHIPYPDIVLRKLIRNAPSSAKYIFSVPNVAYYENRINLINGHWNYSSSGILESTHVRFFTLESFIRLLDFVGLYPSKVILLNRILPPGGVVIDFTLDNLLNLCAINKKGQPFCYQFVIEATCAKPSRCKYTTVGESGKYKLFRTLAREKLKSWRFM